MSPPALAQALVELKSFLNANTETLQWPELTEWEQLDNHQVQLVLKVNSKLEYFAGHFPDQAVLPGVVQIHWAGEFAKKLFGVQGFHTLQGAKFNSMVLPNAEILLDLTFKPEKNSVRFTFHRANEKFSLGSLLFSTPA